MGADIVERLAADLQDYADGLGAAPIIVHDRDELSGLLVRAAAEIVRLRGEVAARSTVFGCPECGTGMQVDYSAKPSQPIAPAEAKGPAPAMPNGVEGLVEALEMPDGYEVQEFLPGGWHYAWTRSDGERMVSGTTWNHPALAAIAAWQAVYDRAADNRDAAGVAEEYDEGPTWTHDGKRISAVFSGDGKVGLFITANPGAVNGRIEFIGAPVPIPTTPAAVPAGEAVAVYEGNPCVECGEDTGTGHFPGCCLGTTTQPADGEAVALGWRVRERRSSDGELLDCFIEAPPVDGMAYGLEVLGDDYTGYGDVEGKLAHCKMIVAWANATPPAAPVQAAPQEGGNPLAEVHEYMNQRVAHDVAAFRRAAHHSACELGELAAVAVKCGAYEYGDPSNRYYDFSSEQLQAFVAAIQHRGDSRGGEG